MIFVVEFSPERLIVAGRRFDRQDKLDRMFQRHLRVTLVPVFVLMLAASYVLTAQKDQKVEPADLHRPTKTPDRIILTWSDDPATTQSVTWRTETSVTSALAEIAPADDGPLFVKTAAQVKATTAGFKTDLSLSHVHSATFTGLKPNTLYVYRVGDGWNWSEWSHFRTAGSKTDPLTFVYVGDAQNDIFSMWSRVIRMAYTVAPQTRFIVHAGDLINSANKDDEWGDWFRAAGWINQTIPSFPSPGNHEYARGLKGRDLTGHWRPTFTLPENGPAGLEESCYYLDIQGIRMISLNSNEKQQEQVEWIDKVLADNPNEWAILTFHHPIFSAAKGRDNKDLRELWQPIFDKHKVDLVLTGHDHTYARSNMRTGMNVRSTDAGTVYVVSVSGPKMYNLERETWMARGAEDTQLFQVIRVEGQKLTYESRTARGILYDAFELRKRRNRPNQLINRIPESPSERLRDSNAVSGG